MHGLPALKLSSLARQFSLLVALSLGASSVFSDQQLEDNAWHWLERLSKSFSQLNYQGVFTFQRGSTLESLRLSHAVMAGEEFERLEYLDGDRRQIIRRGQSVQCIHPGHQLQRLYTEKQALSSPMATDALRPYYRAAISGDGRVAGHLVVDVILTPLDTHRWGRKLSIDKDTGLLLRSEIIGDEQRVLERFQFVDVKIGGELPDQLFEANNQFEAANVPTKSLDAEQCQWRAQWLPGGFELVSISADDLQQVATFTDGLAVITLFVEPVVNGEDGGASTRRGATVAFSRILSADDTLLKVTVVGEVPMATAQKIAESVTYTGS